MAKCPPKYKNLNEIQSYSEQKYATVQWAEQNCENDEYLKQAVDELDYRSPARIRKRWSPILVDDVKSYGYQMNSDKTITFSKVQTHELLVDFNDFSLIDSDRSDCAFVSYLDNQGNIHRSATIPRIKTGTSIKTCRSLEPGMGINSYWYCGFDKNKHYHVRPDWIKDMFDSEIPAVCRAQTFVIPSGVTDGRLYSVDLRIENNGVRNSNWGSPLIVQLWNTKKMQVEKTRWDGNRKTSVSYNPKQYEYIYVPWGDVYHPLATAEYNPSRISPGLQNLRFDKSIKVVSGERYALVMMSPLSHWEHCPRIGGWGRNCEVDKYSGGDAFLSENNGRSWKRYGSTDLSVNSYSMGMMTPQDFAFVCHIGNWTEGYRDDEDFYLYLKPIHLNPIKKIQLVPVGYGDEPQYTNLKLEYQVSKSGRANDWVTLNPNTLSYRFNKDPATGEYPHFVFVRVKMSTTNPNVAPFVDSINIIVEMDIPKEMYVRTLKYNPKTSPMLGASAWSKVFSNFETDPGVTGSMEIIREKLGTEHFDIITAKELPLYDYIEGLDSTKINDESLSVRYKYLMDTPSAIELLKAHKVYVKPYTYTSNGETITHPMSFENGIQFDNSPAYPIVEGELTPLVNAQPIPISEWIDYAFDYDNDVLTFNEVMNQYDDGNGGVITEGIEEYLPVGTLEITYQSIFVQDLTSVDVGIREKSEGFVLDYFKEECIINESDAENGFIPLKFEACDPVREVVINDEEYIEDIDFTVDYLNNKIIFPVIDVNASSTLLDENIGKEMHVVYTPNLDDTGLVLAYRGIRKNTSKQMRIKGNYLEYKV